MGGCRPTFIFDSTEQEIKESIKSAHFPYIYYYNTYRGIVDIIGISSEVEILQ
jgi:hypothetical protein